VLLAALELIGSAREPGAIVAAEWPWRRTRFGDPLIEGAEPPHA
jgi:hypothetical protein